MVRNSWYDWCYFPDFDVTANINLFNAYYLYPTWGCCILCLEQRWCNLRNFVVHIVCTKHTNREKAESILSTGLWGVSVQPFYMVNFIFSCDQAALWMVFSVRLSVCPSVHLSVCPSVRLSHLFDYVPIIVSSRNFQELSHWTRVRPMQKVKVRGQRSRSQRSRPNLTVSGP